MPSLLEGDIKIGKVKVPKAGVVLGGAVAVGIIGYAYYNRSSGGTVEDMSGGDPSIDPETGLPYYDQYGSGVQGVGIYDPSTGETIGTGYGVPQLVQQVSNNAGWTQAAVALMRAYGTEADVAALAIGRALSGQPLTQDQLNLFNTARALQGEPPNGYPPIQMATNNNPPDVPANPDVQQPAPVTGVKVKEKGKTYITLDWPHSEGATGYTVWKNGSRHVSVRYSLYTAQGLKPNTSYRFEIRAISADGKEWGPPAAITVKTDR